MIARPMCRCAAICLALLFCFVPTQAQNPENDDAVFREFLDWAKTQPLEVLQQDPRPVYCAFLEAQGIGEVECARRWEFLIPRTRESLETTEILYDKIYEAPSSDFKSTPNEFLVTSTADVTPGQALDIHMGQGRNALYLAEQGWEVTGFDISQEGITRALAEAERRGVRITAVQQSHQEFDFGVARWDLVVMSYAWIPLDDAALINKIIDSVKAGGLLVFEHHLETSGRPRDEGEWLPRPNELLTTFGRMRVLKYEETIAVRDWGGDAPGNVVRMLATKEPE